MLKTLKGTVPSEPPPAPNPSMLIVGFPAKLNANVDRKETLVTVPSKNWNQDRPVEFDRGAARGTLGVVSQHAERQRAPRRPLTDLVRNT